MTESVTRLRAPLIEDRYGAQVPDWDNATSLDIDGCAVAPRDAEEDRGNGRQAVLIGHVVYSPAGADVIATDRLVVRGDTYEVDGEPGVWVNPFSSVERGVEIRVRRVVG